MTNWFLLFNQREEHFVKVCPLALFMSLTHWMRLTGIQGIRSGKNFGNPHSRPQAVKGNYDWREVHELWWLGDGSNVLPNE